MDDLVCTLQALITIWSFTIDTILLYTKASPLLYTIDTTIYPQSKPPLYYQSLLTLDPPTASRRPTNACRRPSCETKEEQHAIPCAPSKRRYQWSSWESNPEPSPLSNTQRAMLRRCHTTRPQPLLMWVVAVATVYQILQQGNYRGSAMQRGMRGPGTVVLCASQCEVGDIRPR
jgi:hypothetical protein